jgi:hypothetical protein
MKMIVDADGGARFIHNDDLAEIMRDTGATLTIRRASHVEPDESGAWHADLSPVGGPVLGAFRRREDALTAEREWLESHNVPLPVNQ